MGASAAGASCQACRVAKVRCDRGDPCCARCGRLGVPCVVDRKRSRWESVRATSRAAAPPGIAEDLDYAGLAYALGKYPPGAESACFKFQVRALLETLISKAIHKNDAAAISWATLLMNQHGFPLADFEAAFRRWRGNAGGAGIAEDNDGVADGRWATPEGIATSMHPQLRDIFCSTRPSVAMVCVKDKPKRYFANAASHADIARLERAETWEESADAHRVHRTDYFRALEAYTEGLKGIMQAMKDSGSNEIVSTIPPRLGRIVRDSGLSSANGSSDSMSSSCSGAKPTKPTYELHRFQSMVHVSQGGECITSVLWTLPVKRGGRTGSSDVGSALTLSDADIFSDDSSLDVAAWLDEIGGWDALGDDEHDVLQDLVLHSTA